MEKPVLILGAKGIGPAALEIFESNGIVVYGFLDEDASLFGTDINNIPVLGDTSDQGYLKIIGQKCEAFIASDDDATRLDLVDYLMKECNVMPVNAIHQNAIITKSATIGHGNFINAGVMLGANSKIGQHCIINSGVTIEHSSQIGDFVQVGAGTVINNNVKIENNVFIGTGATIVAGITIGENARIGAGSVVVANIKEGETVFGNPAMNVKRK